jgi:hypothetical protein
MGQVCNFEQHFHTGERKLEYLACNINVDNMKQKNESDCACQGAANG